LQRVGGLISNQTVIFKSNSHKNLIGDIAI